MAEEDVPLVSRQGFQVQLDCFFNVRDRFFERVPLRLASFQFRVPGIKTMLILFDNDSRLSAIG